MGLHFLVYWLWLEGRLEPLFYVRLLWMFDDGAAILGIAGMDGVFLKLIVQHFYIIVQLYYMGAVHGYPSGLLLLTCQLYVYLAWLLGY